MSPSFPIPETVHAQFPKGANRRKIVSAAWHPDKSTLDRPAANGMDGWTHVGQVATYALLGRLQAEGFTWVSLEAGGTANPHHDVLISKLL